MTNEAVEIEAPRIIKRFTVADGTGIAEGCLLQLSSDPNTASASDGANVFAGIAIEEKTASDGITEIAAAQDGKYDLMVVAGGSVTLGHLVKLSGPNVITDAVEADTITGAIVGKALETGSAGEKIAVLVGHN